MGRYASVTQGPKFFRNRHLKHRLAIDQGDFLVFGYRWPRLCLALEVAAALNIDGAESMVLPNAVIAMKAVDSNHEGRNRIASEFYLIPEQWRNQRERT